MKKDISPILEIKNLTISYGGDPVVEELFLSITTGSFIGLIGPNGAGKTSLLLTISGQFKPQTGTVYFKDCDIYGNNLSFKKNIGFVHENPFFYPYLTTQEFLYFIADIKGRSPAEAGRQIPELLKTVNMSDERDKLTANLSQGMKKKLAVAAAMIGYPRILFLDEALNGVDFESAFGIKKALAGYVKNGGVVILSTHVLEVVEKICDRYLVLKQGKIIADLQAREIKNLAGGGLEKYIIKMLNR